MLEREFNRTMKLPKGVQGCREVIIGGTIREVIELKKAYSLAGLRNHLWSKRHRLYIWWERSAIIQLGTSHDKLPNIGFAAELAAIQCVAKTQE